MAGSKSGNGSQQAAMSAALRRQGSVWKTYKKENDQQVSQCSTFTPILRQEYYLHPFRYAPLPGYFVRDHCCPAEGFTFVE